MVRYLFVAPNEHGRSLIDLIRAIRACRDCVPALYAPCATHGAELDRLYPEACPDRECPACTQRALSRVHDNGDYRV